MFGLGFPASCFSGKAAGEDLFPGLGGGRNAQHLEGLAKIAAYLRSLLASRQEGRRGGSKKRCGGSHQVGH
jgi:hypothetical protein